MDMQRNSLEADRSKGMQMSPGTVPADQPKGSAEGTKLCAAGGGGRERREGKTNSASFIRGNHKE